MLSLQTNRRGTRTLYDAVRLVKLLGGAFPPGEQLRRLQNFRMNYRWKGEAARHLGGYAEVLSDKLVPSRVRTH